MSKVDISKEDLRLLADSIEKYLDLNDIAVIKTGVLSYEKYAEAKKRVAKKMEKLRKGKVKGILDMDNIELIEHELERLRANG